MAPARLLRIPSVGYVYPSDETPAGHAMMLERIRQRLLVSAMGRNLAVDLAARHGSAAAGELQAMIDQGCADASQRDVLLKARKELARLGL